jgi:hypothetical protein
MLKLLLFSCYHFLSVVVTAIGCCYCPAVSHQRLSVAITVSRYRLSVVVTAQPLSVVFDVSGLFQ